MSERRLRNAAFETTRWSLIVAAGKGQATESRTALSDLCEAYWQPLYGYVRRRVTDVAEAQDLTQEFFSRLLENEVVRTADPGRGRFRSFLLTALRNFMANEWDRARAQKRGGGKALLSLDFAAADSRSGPEPSGGMTAEQVYDRQWAVQLLNRVVRLLADEHSSGEAALRFDVLSPFLAGATPSDGYAEAAERLGMSEPGVRKAVSRLRQRYRQLLRAEIAETVSSEADVDDEIRRLFATFRQ